jgi:integrase
MSTYETPTEERTAHPTTTDLDVADPFSGGERHAREDAPTERAYQLLLEGAQQLDDALDRRLARTALLLCGRLGLRGGELAHLRTEWIDWRRSMLVIPRQDDCTKGRDGGICGYCRSRADERAAHTPGLSPTESAAQQWHPKTERAAREVPFGHSPRASLCLERFADSHDGWPLSKQGVNRRVDDAARAAEEIAVDDVYPHALRSAAAQHLAARGLGVLPLQAFFGWADVSTAMKYVAMSGEHTARALHLIHSR